MIRFASLGSGSKGNATLVEGADTRLLVDCGFALREAELRLQRLGVAPDTVDAVLVTHEHSDHLGGVGRFARRYGIPVFMTHGTQRAWRDAEGVDTRLISPHAPFQIKALEVQPYPVPHDAREPCQYRFSDGTRRLGILSDAGHVTPHMREVLADCDALMLECNHDLGLLAAGPYPPALRRRVGGMLGHLSNAQAAALAAIVVGGRMQHLVLTHLSEVNNTPAHARSAVVAALGRDEPWIACACQQAGVDWREVV